MCVYIFDFWAMGLGRGILIQWLLSPLTRGDPDGVGIGYIIQTGLKFINLFNRLELSKTNCKFSYNAFQETLQDTTTSSV